MDNSFPTFAVIVGLALLIIGIVGLIRGKPQPEPEPPTTHKVEGHSYYLIHSDKCKCLNNQPLEK